MRPLRHRRPPPMPTSDRGSRGAYHPRPAPIARDPPYEMPSSRTRIPDDGGTPTGAGTKIPKILEVIARGPTAGWTRKLRQSAAIFPNDINHSGRRNRSFPPDPADGYKGNPT